MKIFRDKSLKEEYYDFFFVKVCNNNIRITGHFVEQPGVLVKPQKKFDFDFFVNSRSD